MIRAWPWPRSAIWSNRAFTLLWSGQTISELGSEVSTVALPLIALTTLQATVSQMGVLSALSRLPFLLYVFAGVWVDRTRRRPVLIGSDVARALLLLALPAAALAGLLSFPLLAATIFLVMLLTVWFDTAYQSYLPSLVERSRLLDGNTRLESSKAAARLVGPGVGGLAVQVLTAPIAIVLDALSFLTSAALVQRIRHREPAPERTSGHGIRSVLDDVVEGFRFLGGDRVQRAVTIGLGVVNLAWAMELALYFVFAVRVLGLPAPLVGLSLTGGGPGALIGSSIAARVQRRFGVCAAIVGGLLTFALGALLIPAAPAVPAVAVPMLVVAGFVMSVGGQVCAVNVLTLRQSVTPDRLMGRVNASFFFVVLGVSPLGSLAGGFAGQLLGPRQALLIAIAGMFAAPLLLVLSPLRRVRDLPSLEGS